MKKLLLPIITLIIGFGIGYFIESRALNSPVNELTHQLTTAKVNTVKGLTFLSRPEDATVTTSDAQSGIKLFSTLNENDIANGSGMFVDDPQTGKQPLKGFLIQKASLQDIFAKNPKWTGIRVYFAKHPNHLDPADRTFTVIFTAALSSNPTGIPLNDIDSTDPIYDHVYPCPTVCGSLGK